MISVLMTVYNEPEEWLNLSVHSLMESLGRSDEVIIVVDNPKYNFKLLENLQRNDSRIKAIANEENIGLPASLNKAFSFSKGNLIARMDADDISYPDRFKESIRYMNKGQFDFISTQVMDIDEFGNQYPWGIVDAPKSKNVGSSMKFANIFWHPTWLLTRQVFETLGGYREIFGAEDYDFIARAYLSGFKIGVLDKVELSKRQVKSGISQKWAYVQMKNANLIKKEIRHNRMFSTDTFLIKKHYPEAESYCELVHRYSESKKLGKVSILIQCMFSWLGWQFICSQVDMKIAKRIARR